MENRVGDNVPPQKKVDELLKQLASVVEQLKPFFVTLHKDERAATLKPHKGAETLVEKTYSLATRYGVTVKNVPLEGMMNDLRLASQVQPFDALFSLGAQLAADTALQAKSEFYTAFLAYYGALCKAAEHDPALAAEIKPIQDEMRTLRKPRTPAAAAEAGNGSAVAAAGGAPKVD